MRKSCEGYAGRIVLALIAISLIVVVSAFGDDVARGARIIAQLINVEITAEPTMNSPSVKLLDEIESYRASQDTLEDEDAIRRWIELALKSVDEGAGDDLAGYTARDSLTGQPVGFRSMVASVPPPRTWETLAAQARDLKQSENNPAAVFTIRLFVATLIGDESGQTEAMQALDAHAELLVAHDQVDEALARIRRVRAMTRDDIGAWLAQVVDEAANADEYEWSVEIPDVVTLLGEEKAQPWLHRVLLAANTSLEVPVGDATRKLAQRIAVDRVEDLRAPQWRLVRGLDSDRLFVALEERFGRPGKSGVHNWSYTEAQAHHLLSLIVKGRTDEAGRFAARLARKKSLTLSDKSLSELERAGFSAQTQSFLEEMLKSEPALPLWDWYLKLSAYTGRAEAALAFIRQLSEAADSSSIDNATLKAPYAKALLAFDRVEEGAAQLKELLEDGSDRKAGEHGRQLATIGALLGRSDWVEAGLSASAEAIERADSQRTGYSKWSDAGKHVRVLLEIGRVREAETFLLAQLEALRASFEKESDASSMFIFAGRQQAPVDMLGVYAAGERWGEVLEWIRSYPYWGAEDLSAFFSSKDATDTPVGLHVARALVERGRGGEAVPILEALLHKKPGHDATYALLVEQQGQGASALLDALYAKDRYEERPLIWKARIALDVGALPEAKRLLQEAIATDPSDGEQGPGDRMRAYALLAEVLDREGADNKAQLYRRAVGAIRLSEQADRFAKAGLYARAISMYQTAAMQFEDAYCIQSRLAIRLTNQGRFDDAAEHYRIAYRLMPDSFGRIESHCFLCENAFSDPRAQSIASEVFKSYSEQSPDKPQVHYMVGYLRKAQARPAEAVESFRRAVAIDPLYISAWKQLSEAGMRIHLPAWEHDLVALKLLELDPLQRHAKPDLSLVTDLDGLWLRLEQAAGMRASTPDNLFSLDASRAFMAERRRSVPAAQRELFELSARLGDLDDPSPPPPGLGLLETKLVAAVSDLGTALRNQQ